jgi:F-type H+-transporting ATPase subunit delta
MKIPRQAKREAKALFRSCIKDGVLQDTLARAAVERVIQLKPRKYLAILSQFHRLVKLDIDRRTARIESAVALAPEFETQVRSNLEKVYGPGLNITFGQNASLIGGMKVQVGSDVYDGSVQGRLAALRESF